MHLFCGSAPSMELFLAIISIISALLLVFTLVGLGENGSLGSLCHIFYIMHADMDTCLPVVRET
jgi:hypothetical protein